MPPGDLGFRGEKYQGVGLRQGDRITARGWVGLEAGGGKEENLVRFLGDWRWEMGPRQQVPRVRAYEV